MVVMNAVNRFPGYAPIQCTAGDKKNYFDIKTFDANALNPPPIRMEKLVAFEILYFETGAGTLSIDGEEHSIDGPVIFCLCPGQTRSFSLKGAGKGYELSFSEDFLFLCASFAQKAGWLNYYQTGKRMPAIKIGAALHREMSQILRKMLREHTKDHVLRSEILSGLLNILVIDFTRELVENGQGMMQSRSNEIVDRFLGLVKVNCKKLKRTGQYADLLCCTSNYLNQIVKKTTGRTASFHIQETIMLEAKQYLLHKNSSMKEVACHVGFDDFSHFSKFFKKCSGINFSGFKKANEAKAIYMGAIPFFSLHSVPGLSFILLVILTAMLFAALYLYSKAKEITRLAKEERKPLDPRSMDEQLSSFEQSELDDLLEKRRSNQPILLFFFLCAACLSSTSVSANGYPSKIEKSALFSQPGIIILFILIMIPVLLGIFLTAVRVTKIVSQYNRVREAREQQRFQQYLDSLPDNQAQEALSRRRQSLSFKLRPRELAGNNLAQDTRGLLHNIETSDVLPFVAAKKRATHRPPADRALGQLISAYIVCAAGWLIIGTSIGEYIGIKFVLPDVDHESWLSFGRLRPVHTNAVFWGWASMGMLGLGHYIVPRISNTSLYSIKKGWYALILLNLAVILGSICLMAGINNGGGEYREYIWPVMALFGLGLLLTLQNFLRTIARRTTKEIYISNWYIVSALMFFIVIALVGYIPWWQNGLGETIVQGYYMHQAVGMWFMLFTLGIVYYFLPQVLNKPIYSYSLGILAFWSQILFYTTIGTHHFLFSSIPWWLQTVAIVGSVGMIIPVTAGTTNFLMTFKGSWGSIGNSYTLPFFLTGIIFYFTGSMQGTAEAFRSTNLIWHLTDFTVAHSHLTMYGIISFLLWAGIYALIPRLTGKEAPQVWIGAHFWLALIGLLFYTVPLMIGATLKGLLWIDGKPFVDGLTLMAPYWLWRSIGGTLMWCAHLVFCYNMYRMMAGTGIFSRKIPAHPKTNHYGILQ
jgi:cytochrome c oxidase cbb3-type subunit I